MVNSVAPNAARADDSAPAEVSMRCSGWQETIGRLPGPIRRGLLKAQPRQSVQIGRNALYLDMRQFHERRYFERVVRQQKTIDLLIAERCVRPGDVVLDAGANIGFASLAYLALGAREVHAVEPVSALYERLARIADPRLRAYRAALSDRNGTQAIFLSKAHNQGNSLSAHLAEEWPWIFGRSPATEMVRVARADDCFESSVAFEFMKIDVEGSEAALLDGAADILSRHRPRAVQIEIFGEYFDAVHKRLTAYFEHTYRAIKDADRLVLEEPTIEPRKGPPIFVYTNEAL
jgi:FkbM family methyltransferase